MYFKRRRIRTYRRLLNLFKKTVCEGVPVNPKGSSFSLSFSNVDPRDHAETPFEAYRDVEPILSELANVLRK